MKQTSANFITGEEIPSNAIQRYQKQLIAKATQAIDTQSVNERDVSSLMISIRQKDLPKFKQKIREFRKDINEEAESIIQGRDQVYCLSVQLFSLMKKESL